MNTMHTKYRPTAWDEVFGHGPVCSAIQSALAEKKSRAFLLTGPPGLGKTTFARLIARDLGIDPEASSGNYIEYDGATNTGVDDMRAIVAKAQLRPFGENKNRVIVIDECHALSKSAWNSSLKAVEEPPDGVCWVFCTSEPKKVPASIRSRCQDYQLSKLPDRELEALIEGVLEKEGQSLSDAVFDMVCDYAEGIPRRALVALGSVLGRSEDEAKKLLAASDLDNQPEVIDFCRALMARKGFADLAKMAVRLGEVTTAEGVRNVVCAYFTKVIGSGKDALNCGAIIRAFGYPYPDSANGMYPVIVSLVNLEDQ